MRIRTRSDRKALDNKRFHRLRPLSVPDTQTRVAACVLYCTSPSNHLNINHVDLDHRWHPPHA